MFTIISHVPCFGVVGHSGSNETICSCNDYGVFFFINVLCGELYMVWGLGGLGKICRAFREILIHPKESVGNFSGKGIATMGSCCLVICCLTCI